MHPRTCARGGTVGVGVTSAVGADGAVERVEPDQKRKFFFQSETARWLKEPRDDVPSSPAGAPLRTGSYWRGRRDSPPATAHNPARSLRESDDIGYRRWIRRPRSIRRAEASGSSETKGRTPRVVVEPDAGDLSTRRDRSRYRRARVPPSRSDRDTKAPNPRSFGADRFTRASRKSASPVPRVGPLALVKRVAGTKNRARS